MPKVDNVYSEASDLFEAALREAPGRRTQFVREGAGVDSALCGEVLSLLAHHAVAKSFLKRVPILEELDDEDELDSLDPLASHPEKIGSYRILGRIGSGGMGVVYLAEQNNPRRQVAIKVHRRAAANAADHRRLPAGARDRGGPRQAPGGTGEGRCQGQRLRRGPRLLGTRTRRAASIPKRLVATLNRGLCDSLGAFVRHGTA